jgi:hypothetical protein
MHAKFWSWELKGRDNSEDLGVDGKVISECMLEVNSVMSCGLDAPG